MINKKLYSGKAKDLYHTEEDGVLLVRYKDQVTMLNGGRKEEMVGKGRLNNLISSLLFERLNAAGVKTHFIERISETEQLNQQVDIIPLEVVLRNRVAGSFAKRFGLVEGQVLPRPIIEFYYKSDELDDPFINDEHIAFLGLTSEAELAYIKAETHRINDLLTEWFAQVGLTLVDFKLEFGKDKAGDIILADEFSPDNCRLWDEQGQHMDKDVFRRDLGSLTDVYSRVLEKLQDLG